MLVIVKITALMLVDIENFKSNLHSYWLSVCRIHVESRCWLLMQSGIGSAMTMITNPPNVIIGQAFADQGMYLSCRNTRGARCCCIEDTTCTWLGP